MLVFPSLSYELWKPGLPFWWNPSPSTKLILPCHKSPKFHVFGIFEGKKRKTPFSGEKRGKKHKKLKILDFLMKFGQFGHFFLQNRSPVLPRFLPGSCPVLARFLPGSPRFCPVLPGSARFSSSFLGDFSIFGGFFVRFLLGPEKITKNSEVFDRKEKICKIQKFSLGMRRIAKFGTLHEFLWSGSTKSRKFMSLAAVGKACEVWRWYPPRAHGALRAMT